jgi:hypothetical protein
MHILAGGAGWVLPDAGSEPFEMLREALGMNRASRNFDGRAQFRYLRESVPRARTLALVPDALGQLSTTPNFF